MINVMNPRNESMKEVESNLDPQLWHACAGGMVQMPAVNSKVFYFPQGHIEHAQVKIDLKNYPNLPALIPCRVSKIKYLADQGTDEVYTKITLLPLRANDFDFSDDGFVGSNNNNNINNNGNDIDGTEKPASFAKTLTQSDANNGGGFSVPRYCAETIFPRLDYSAEPPVQTILAKDVHGVTWKFRHIYRGTPRRHLLTTGWSNFVNQKKLIAGDSIVFLRAENGDLCVGIRRPKRGVGGGPEIASGWNNGGGCGPSYGAFLRDDESKMIRNFSGTTGLNMKVKAESVIEGANLAASGQPFEVVYYPRSSTPEFFVKASVVKAAMQVQWCPGMRFKMAFETEDSSRISWFMGTVSSAQVADPIHWSNSPWRLLQVAWDEPELLQNVKRVNPWLVELVATMPTIHMSPFSPPRKKLRFPQNPDSPFSDQLQLPTLFPSSTTLGHCSPVFGLPDMVPAGIQAARRSQFGHFMSDHLHINKPNHPTPFTTTNFLAKPQFRENLSTFLTMTTTTSDENCKKDDTKVVPFKLFGKPILTEQQISESSGDSTRSTVSNGTIDSSSEGGYPGLDEQDIGRNLSLSSLGSYEELYKKIAQHVWQDKVREAEQFTL
ncbi:hypothetical protein RND81_03G089800 [Saponaria officinalis]|uniref:Auxin response factor n=1 Tax=Saponaria officinalis TaxID=3572 RepID=A0AAW1LZ83_SAPOF